MATRSRFYLILACLLGLTIASFSQAAAQESVEKNDQPTIALPEGMGEAMVKEAARVTAEFQEQASSLFERRPLGWDLKTLDYLYHWALEIPLLIDDLLRHIMEQSQLLGVAGSLIMLTFLVAVFYSLI